MKFKTLRERIRRVWRGLTGTRTLTVRITLDGKTVAEVLVKNLDQRAACQHGGYSGLHSCNFARTHYMTKQDDGVAR